MSNIIKIQDVLENKISLDEARFMLILHEGQQFKYFDEGCTRYVFVNKDKSKVIKLCKEHMSNMFNTEEAKIYEEAPEEDKNKMAKTKLVNGFIEQEFCLPIKYGGIKLNLEQRLFASKCRDEVGWDKEGNLVCFDLDEYMKY